MERKGSQSTTVTVFTGEGVTVKGEPIGHTLTVDIEFGEYPSELRVTLFGSLTDLIGMGDKIIAAAQDANCQRLMRDGAVTS